MYTTNRASPAQVCVVRVPDRRAPVVRDVVRAWRRLTGEGAPRTVVACSGGADSVALLLSLASVTRDLVVVYIRHDMRDAAIVEAECRRVADLADALGLHFESGEAPTDRGNLEAQARAGRYAALADSARNCAAPFVATGHHADDQLETMVMGLLRGSGPAGLSGVAECRLIDDRADEVRLIRPLLGIRRADTEALCAEAGWIPCEDETNAGTTRLRSLLRHGVLRELGAAHPDGAVHAARAAAAMHDIDGLLAEVADQLFGDALEWPRHQLQTARRVVLTTGLRRAAARLLDGRGLDALGGRVLDPVVSAVMDHSTEPRRFEWTRGVRVEVTASRVRMFREGE